MARLKESSYGITVKILKTGEIFTEYFSFRDRIYEADAKKMKEDRYGDDSESLLLNVFKDDLRDLKMGVRK